MGCVRWRLNKHTLLSTHKQIELIHCCCCFRVTPPLHGSLATFSQETSSVLITLHCDKQNPRLHLTLHYCINAHVRLPCVSKFQSDLTWLTVQSILTYHYFLQLNFFQTRSCNGKYYDMYSSVSSKPLLGSLHGKHSFNCFLKH